MNAENKTLDVNQFANEMEIDVVLVKRTFDRLAPSPLFQSFLEAEEYYEKCLKDSEEEAVAIMAMAELALNLEEAWSIYPLTKPFSKERAIIMEKIKLSVVNARQAANIYTELDEEDEETFIEIWDALSKKEIETATLATIEDLFGDTREDSELNKALVKKWDELVMTEIKDIESIDKIENLYTKALIDSEGEKATIDKWCKFLTTKEAAKDMLFQLSEDSKYYSYAITLIAKKFYGWEESN